MQPTRLLRILFAIALTSILIPARLTNMSGQTSRVPVAAAHTIHDLIWITGAWQTAPGGRAQIEEHWTQPAGASMLGMSRTVAGGRTVEFEYLRLEQRDDGIFYVAHPKARCPGTDFKLTRLTRNEAVFENPQHDFPKRITYRKTAEGLVATVDAGEGTKAQTFSYLPIRK